MNSLQILDKINNLVNELNSSLESYLDKVNKEVEYIDYSNQLQFDLIHIIENIELKPHESEAIVKELRDTRLQRRVSCLGRKMSEINNDELLKLKKVLETLNIKTTHSKQVYQFRTYKAVDILNSFEEASQRSSIRLFDVDNVEIISEPITRTLADKEQSHLTQVEDTNKDYKSLVEFADEKEVQDKLFKAEELKELNKPKLPAGVDIPSTVEGWKALVKESFYDIKYPAPEGHFSFMMTLPELNVIAGSKLEDEEKFKTIINKISTPVNDYVVTRKNKQWALTQDGIILTRSSKLDKIIEKYKQLGGRLLITDNCVNMFMNFMIKNYIQVDGELEKIS